VINHLQSDNRSRLEEQLQTLQIVTAAADLSHHILDSLPDRLAHSQGVARRAQLLTLTVEPHQARLLVAAAWLHDIGYAADLRETGFHPLDGARHCAPSAGRRQSVTLSPTTPGRVSSPEFSSSTGNWMPIRSPRTLSQTP
jgi:hypothetical protein